MLFTHETAESFARWAEQPDDQPFNALNPEGFTLAAAIELACRRESWSGNSYKAAFMILDNWASKHLELQGALAALNGQYQLTHRQMGDAVWLSLHTPQSVTETPAKNFLRAYTQGLKGVGFSVKLAYALAGALEGMVDNLGQHSFDNYHKRGGLVAYRLRPRAMAFTVADLGRGALTSLHENPAWLSLSTDQEAIESIVMKQASRRMGLGPGEGFRTLFKSLANLNGELRLRSGIAVTEMQGNFDHIHGIGQFSPYLVGFQINVKCKLD